MRWWCWAYGVFVAFVFLIAVGFLLRPLVVEHPAPSRLTPVTATP